MNRGKLHFNSRAFAAAGIAGAFLLLQTAFAAELAIGAGMPSFALKSMDGQTVSSEGLSGKRALVVFFMDNHCNYCQAYQSRLMDLQKEYGDQNVQFVLINPSLTSADVAALKVHPDKIPNPFPNMLIDETQGTARAFGATRTPEAFVFGTDHKLVYRGQIDDNTEAKMVRISNLKQALESVLTGTPKVIEKPITTPFGCTIKWKQ